MARSSGSTVQYSWFQPRNQPVKVGGSNPCFTVTVGVRGSLSAGSLSMYLTAGHKTHTQLAVSIVDQVQFQEPKDLRQEQSRPGLLLSSQ